MWGSSLSGVKGYLKVMKGEIVQLFGGFVEGVKWGMGREVGGKVGEVSSGKYVGLWWLYQGDWFVVK